MRYALTGGASGIGAALVHRLKSQGHWVTSLDIVEPAGVDQWIPVDLANPQSITQAVTAAEGPFDAFVNNAGIPPRDGMAEQVLRVNWFGAVQVFDAILPKLATGASIVTVASRAGAHWRENLSEVHALQALDPDGLAAFVASRQIDPTRAYNLSKEALIVMTIARTEEMIARGLRMNAVSPAAVSTGILPDFAAAFGARMSQNIARAGRAGTPEEVAEVIAFLASPQSHWIKGQDITIDGGMSAMSLADAIAHDG